MARIGMQRRSLNRRMRACVTLSHHCALLHEAQWYF